VKVHLGGRRSAASGGSGISTWRCNIGLEETGNVV